MFLDSRSQSNPLRRRLRDLTLGERKEEAKAFLRRFHRETGSSDADYKKRLNKVISDLNKFEYYEQTYEELCYGAKLAWRNHSKCIGRYLWRTLEVIDCRKISNPDEVASNVVNHMSKALGDGRIKSIISIFPPVQGRSLPCYIESDQIIQYAGYTDAHGRVIGDPQQITNTKIALSLGWKPKGSPSMFDILPFCIREPGGKRRLYEIDRNLIKEITIEHPTIPAISTLGLRWYPVPIVSNMILTIGGIDYPCAPFNGFYMGTEIACRDFCDENRYNLLSNIAEAIGCSKENTQNELWKDQALLEINRAVLYSFDKAKITVVDHHEASDQYMNFVQRELAAGRTPSGDWSWIVPPQASSSCPVFHLKMRDLHAVPNFYHSKAGEGALLEPNYEDEMRSKTQIKLSHWRKKFRRRLKKFYMNYTN